MSAETLEIATIPTPKTIIPDTKEIEAKQREVFEEVDQIIVVADPETGALKPITREEWAALDKLVGKLAAGKKWAEGYVGGFFKKHIDNAHKAHKDLIADRDQYLQVHAQPWILATNQAVGLMREFEKAEADREALIKAEAEKKRKEDEKAAAEKAELERKEQLRKDEEARLAKAEALEAKGAKPEEIEKVLTAPPPPPPPPPPPRSVGSYYVAAPALKASNAGTRKNWKWRPKGQTAEEIFASKLALAKAAVENPEAFLEYLDFNDKTLTAKAKSGEDQARVSGVEFYNEPINSNRARG